VSGEHSIIEWIGAALIVLWGLVLVGWVVEIGQNVAKLTEIGKKQQQTLETIAESLRAILQRVR
jgi:hypothetical protein